MRKLAVVCGLLALFIVPALAPLLAQEKSDQSQTPSSDQNRAPAEETKPVKPKHAYEGSKYEISGGYNFRKYYSTHGTTLHMNGWFASFGWNRFTWLGIVGEAVGTYKNEGRLDGDTSIYTFLVGPQFYPLRHRNVTPFGHFLYGAGWYRNSVGMYGGFPGQTVDKVVHSWELGGGLDLSLKRNWGVRLVQIDTTSANFYPSSSSYTNSNLFRFSVGVVYHFGQR